MKRTRANIDNENPSIDRVMGKCISCGQCKNICEKLTGITDNNSIYLNCGQCILICQTGAMIQIIL